MITNLIAATAIAATPNSFDWRPIITSIVLCIVTAGINWWIWWKKGSSKRDTNHFIAFMNESADFREEVRKDRDKLKLELETLGNEKESLRFRIKDLETKHIECSKILDQHTIDLQHAKEQNLVLQAKIKKLKELLYNLNIPESEL